MADRDRAFLAARHHQGLDLDPGVIDGGNAVENPIAPCVVGVLTVMRDAGISEPNFTAASRDRV